MTSRPSSAWSRRWARRGTGSVRSTTACSSLTSAKAPSDFPATSARIRARRTSGSSTAIGSSSWRRRSRMATSDEKREIEEFLYREAHLLDEHRLDEWLGLFTDDVRYLIPLREH